MNKTTFFTMSNAMPPVPVVGSAASLPSCLPAYGEARGWQDRGVFLR